MLLKKEVGVFQLITDTYRLTFPPDRPYVYLDDADGKRLAELFVLSSIHPLHGRDDSTRIGQWEALESPGEVLFSMTAGSSIWQRKTYIFRCFPTRFLYEIEVEGQGQLSDIDLMGVPLPGKSNWFFTPPPFCFAFEGLNGWLGFGIEARPGFIRKQHASGKKVLLWLKAWDPEGVPGEECITNAGGFALSVDPSNPIYEERLRRSIRMMLFADGYDADGFKVDFTARIPSGPGPAAGGNFRF